MKKILIVLGIILLSSGPAAAADTSALIEEAVQSTQARKLEAVGRLIVLEGERKANFDRLYAEYQEALAAANGQYAGLAWRLLEQSKAPSIEETKGVLRDLRVLELKKLDLRDEYFAKFGTMLEPAQFVRLLQIESKADILLRHGVAVQTPFLE